MGCGAVGQKIRSRAGSRKAEVESRAEEEQQGNRG
jgi:hypothetical protein